MKFGIYGEEQEDTVYLTLSKDEKDNFFRLKLVDDDGDDIRNGTIARIYVGEHRLEKIELQENINTNYCVPSPNGNLKHGIIKNNEPHTCAYLVSGQ